jgi:two-component system chemotaxis response regulator CheY
VLAVDDSPVALHMLKVLLESGLRCRFLAADNGLTALGLLASVPVDVILLDINMPVMNGFEFLQRMQEEPAYRSIPVIVISTEGKAQDFHRALAMGARAYLTKPFVPTQLVRLIDELAPPTVGLS